MRIVSLFSEAAGLSVYLLLPKRDMSVETLVCLQNVLEYTGSKADRQIIRKHEFYYGDSKAGPLKFDVLLVCLCPHKLTTQKSGPSLVKATHGGLKSYVSSK